MKDSVLRAKSKSFAIRIVRLYQWLCKDKCEYIMSKQLLKSGTSIGANIHEAAFAQSKRDFVSKMHIALKEAAETDYWLELLVSTDYLTEEQHTSIKADNDELLRLLHSTVNTTKSNMDD